MTFKTKHREQFRTHRCPPLGVVAKHGTMENQASFMWFKPCWDYTPRWQALYRIIGYTTRISHWCAHWNQILRNTMSSISIARFCKRFETYLCSLLGCHTNCAAKETQQNVVWFKDSCDHTFRWPAVFKVKSCTLVSHWLNQWSTYTIVFQMLQCTSVCPLQVHERTSSDLHVSNTVDTTSLDE